MKYEYLGKNIRKSAMESIQDKHIFIPIKVIQMSPFLMVRIQQKPSAGIDLSFNTFIRYYM